MNNENTFCVIMAGGVGTRFWPVSRKNLPKQFLDILGTGKTFIQMTYERFETIVPPQNFYVVTNEEYYSLVKEQLPYLKDEQILLEPVGRNTAPCIEYANQKIKNISSDANIIVTPSDHLIIETDRFIDNIKKALDFVKDNDALVTIGIKPTRPNTGYGYIQFDSSEKVTDSIFKVKTFTEKPNLEMAKFFVESGEFYWNSGMFIWNLNSIEKAFEKYLSEIHKLFTDNFEKINSEAERDTIYEIYNQIKGISIDYGVMEKASNVYLIRSSFTWSDLGTWYSLYENKEKDKNGNVVSGESFMIFDSKNSLFYSTVKDKIYVAKGIGNVILVDTKDAFLIVNIDDEQSIKQIVDELKINGKEDYL